MRKNHFLFYTAIASILVVGRLSSSINFGSQQSAIKISDGATFFVGSSNLVVDGTIIEETSSSINGNPISFNKGILNIEGTEALMTGRLDPAAADTIQLIGNSNIDIEPGSVIKAMTVAGIGNKLSGQPLFASAIPFANASTKLAIALQNTLNQDINLNNGTLTLDDNLRLADNVKLNGPGTIQLNNRRLELGGFYSTPWADDLTFESATDLILHGKTALTGTWLFTGTSSINGNGTVLDISDGGVIEIEAGGDLYIADLYIKGLGTGFGVFVFGDADSTLHLTNVTIELSSGFTMTTGNVVICGHTTIILKDNNWCFENDSKLTVDDRLWLDPCLFNPAEDLIPGQIKASLPLFINHILDISTGGNVEKNIADGNLCIGPNGTIKEVVTLDLDAGEQALLGGNIDANIKLKRDIHIAPVKKIEFAPNAGEIIIDGCGSSIIFSNPPGSQFCIPNGTTVRLKNIIICRINATTFDIAENAQLIIDQNVAFELIDDFIWRSGLLKLELDDPEKISDIFTMIGNGCRRRFIFNPVTEGVETLFDMGGSSIILCNIEMQGLEFSNCIAVENPAIVLAGNAAVGLNEDSPLNFDIEGLGNELILLTDKIKLDGTIAFMGQALQNVLTIRTALEKLPEETDGNTVRQPELILNGDPGIFLASSFGIAGLIFTDPRIKITNNNSNAFVVDATSYMHAFRLNIQKNPIKQNSALFNFEANEITGLGFDPSFIRARTSRLKKKSAFTQLREKERTLNEEHKKATPQPFVRQRINVKKNKKNRAKKRNIVRGLKTRALHLPDSGVHELIYEDTHVRLDLPTTGNIALQNGTITNFFNSSTAPFNLCLQTQSELKQAIDTPVTLETDMHVINILGRDNVIKVTNLFTLQPDVLFLGPDSQVTFKIEEGGYLKFEAGTIIDIPDDSILEFSGNGTVEFGDGTMINLSGEREETVILRSIEDALEETRGFGPFNPENPEEEIDEEIDINADVISRGLLLFSGSIRSVVSPGSEMTIQGVGKMIIDKSCFDVTHTSVVSICPNSTDNIMIEVNGTSVIRVDTGGRLSFGLGTSSHRLDRNGKIVINDGTFELNAEDGELRRGCVTNLSFHDDASLFISNDGRLVLGQNRVQDLPLAQIEKPFNFALQPVRIGGSGLVQFVPRETAPGIAFTGRLQPPTVETFENDTMTFDGLAQFLTETETTLTVSTVFVGEDGLRRVRTRTGAISDPLAADDTIISDNDTTGEVSGQDGSGSGFIIAENGIRS